MGRHKKQKEEEQFPVEEVEEVKGPESSYQEYKKFLRYVIAAEKKDENRVYKDFREEDTLAKAKAVADAGFAKVGRQCIVYDRQWSNEGPIVYQTAETKKLEPPKEVIEKPVKLREVKRKAQWEDKKKKK